MSAIDRFKELVPRSITQGTLRSEPRGYDDMLTLNAIHELIERVEQLEEMLLTGRVPDTTRHFMDTPPAPPYDYDNEGPGSS